MTTLQIMKLTVGTQFLVENHKASLRGLVAARLSNERIHAVTACICDFTEYTGITLLHVHWDYDAMVVLLINGILNPSTCRFFPLSLFSLSHHLRLFVPLPSH